VGTWPKTRSQQRDEVARLVVAELLDDGDRECDDGMALLPAVDAADGSFDGIHHRSQRRAAFALEYPLSPALPPLLAFVTSLRNIAPREREL
jgi:hypothetical protein